ncbi:MAG: ATP-grasp domain-containing protein [Conexivisphaerales archaeon]
MMLIEYAGKKVLSDYGVPVPRGVFVKSSSEAAAEALKFGEAVLKVQIPAGGRGKAGGVRIVDARKENIQKVSSELLSSKFSGYEPVGLLVEEKVKYLQEFYISFTISDVKGMPLFLLSQVGGVDIEQNWNSSRGVSMFIDPIEGVWEFKIRDAVIKSGIDANLAIRIASLATKLYKIFQDLDCRLLEINPLAILEDGNIIALDAKIDLDEDAIYRQRPEITNLIQLSRVNSVEERARTLGLNFVLLDNKGEVGVITGGAGLGMYTIDVLYGEGFRPANFLDLGGGVSKIKVKNAISLVASLPSLKYIFVNVYGGINNLAEVAEGIVEAKSSLEVKVPILVKMQGHFEAQAKEILNKYGVASVTTPNTRKAVRLLKGLIQDGE